MWAMSSCGYRRLRALGLALVLSPSCLGSFDSPSEVTGLRVLAVSAKDGRSYATPGETVTLELSLAAARESEPEVQIVWFGGCYNPEQDAYYRCFADLEDTQGASAPTRSERVRLSSEPTTNPVVSSFDLTLPEDILSGRPPPKDGVRYGTAFVFFAACAGDIRPVEATGEEGLAGSFPIGCFDSEGNQLGAGSFVPGYTQIYVFEDERTNQNPTATGLALNDEPMDPRFAPGVSPCALTEDERAMTGCAAPEPCPSHTIKALVGDVAEVDVGAVSAEGTTLRETIWVNYFADGGQIEASKLVSDAVEGYVGEHEVEWTPPAEPGLVRIWAVVRDTRGGSSVISRTVAVE